MDCLFIISVLCVCSELSLVNSSYSKVGKPSLNNSSMGKDPEGMGWADVQHRCPIADGMWQLALATCPKLLLTKCSVCVQRDPADGNWLGPKPEGSSGRVSWGLWARYATLIPTANKGSAKELSSSAAPKPAWFQRTLGFAVHLKFERTTSLNTCNLARSVEMSWVFFSEIFKVKKNRKSYGIHYIGNKFCQLNFRVCLLSKKLEKKPTPNCEEVKPSLPMEIPVIHSYLGWPCLRSVLKMLSVV